jgi:hypothetical protein
MSTTWTHNFNPAGYLADEIRENLKRCTCEQCAAKRNLERIARQNSGLTGARA